MTGFFGYVGTAFSGVDLAYITEIFGWFGMYLSCALSTVFYIILVLMT